MAVASRHTDDSFIATGSSTQSPRSMPSSIDLLRWRRVWPWVAGEATRPGCLPRQGRCTRRGCRHADGGWDAAKRELADDGRTRLLSAIVSLLRRMSQTVFPWLRPSAMVYVVRIGVARTHARTRAHARTHACTETACNVTVSLPCQTYVRYPLKCSNDTLNVNELWWRWSAVSDGHSVNLLRLAHEATLSVARNSHP